MSDATRQAGNAADVSHTIVNAERTGSALKNDIYHRSASYLSEKQLSRGSVFNLIGNDGKSYTLFQVEGELNDTTGIFECILNSEGFLTHERFVRDGIINGIPNY